MPDRGYPMSGWRMTGAIRIRQGTFFTVMEEEWECRDGSVKWRRAQLATFKLMNRSVSLKPIATLKLKDE